MNSYALLVGVGEYLEPPNMIGHLPTINTAVRRLAEVLMQHGCIPESNIKILIKEEQPQNFLDLPATYSIISSLQTVKQRWPIQKEDFFLFYFMGHGHGSVEGDFIWPLDTCFDLLDRTTLNTSTLVQYVRDIKGCSKLLVFDCCRNMVSGHMGSEKESFGHKKIEVDDVVTLYAVRPGDYALIPRGGELPILTEAFIDAVKDQDCLSIRDLEIAIEDSIQKKSERRFDLKQTPEFLIKGQDKGKIGFLCRNPLAKAATPEEFLAIVDQTRDKIQSMYDQNPKGVRNWGVFNKVVKVINNWSAMLDSDLFIAHALTMLRRNESADVYTVSYMLRHHPEVLLFDRLIAALSQKKHRNTAIWQALAAILEMLRDKGMIARVNADLTLRQNVIALLKTLAAKESLASPPTSPNPFSGFVNWGKILQICQKLQIPLEEVFDEHALNRYRTEEQRGTEPV